MLEADSFVEPRRRKPGFLWLSALLAIAGNGAVTTALQTGRVQPLIGLAIVAGSTVCSLLLILAEALQRQAYAADTAGDEQ